jgi:anti-sigma B factor antagonist
VKELELTAHRRGVSTVVQVAGEVDLATAPRFEKFLLDQLETTHTVLMLDLIDVTHLGAAGLSALMKVRLECGRRRIDLVFGQCSRIVLRAFEVSGMTEVFLADGGTAHSQSS